MKKITILLFAIFYVFQSQAQSLSTTDIESGAKASAQNLFSTLKIKNKRGLEPYLMPLETLKTLAQSYNFSSPREKTNFLRNIDAQHQKMNAKVKKSMDDALLEIQNAGLSLSSLSIKSSKVELKKDPNLPTTVVTLLLTDGVKDHTLFIEGLAYYAGHWYLNEGFNWWK